MFVMDQPICLSGGADGADLQFGMCAGTAGHYVVHWSFKGARSDAPESELAVLTDAQLLEADPYLHRANQVLKRSFPARWPSTNSLLRRNWYQVKDSERVYAVSTIKDGIVQGGTAWAVQMFIDRFDGEACEAYVFDQVVGSWFKWNGAKWQIMNNDPPTPKGVWTGIGTRKLNPRGKEAIRRLLGYKVNTVAE